ncbi:conserved hypothetical protein [Ixodes scapularis]|uniref:C3H1-type domain-containing protein n=1 Tax=Ixodes scapularis TaxID=6945 RepID=B7P1Q8_IXOSC|nr:conserved hypothetical protein [Ixodes scapularis]|eukprot:XP_002433466.1 conserved hypothetical protein [Ixodes scapularis]
MAYTPAVAHFRISRLVCLDSQVFPTGSQYEWQPGDGAWAPEGRLPEAAPETQAPLPPAPLGSKTGPVAPSAAGASVATPPSPPSPTAGVVTGNGTLVPQPASSSSPLLVTAAPLSAGSIMAAAANVKDSRWLQLEVCREYQRNKCSRQDAECKFAHPPPNVEVQNGRVIACYDSIKCPQKQRQGHVGGQTKT